MPSTFKVVYIDYNFIDERYPNRVEDEDKFFTYGFGALYARKFKKYNTDIEVECWKTDPRIDKTYEKEISGVKFIIFPSKKIGKLGQYSIQLIRYLKNVLKDKPNIIFNISSIRHLLFYSVSIHLKNYPLVVQHHGEATAIYKFKINSGLKKLFYLAQIPFEWYVFKFVDHFFVLDKRIVDYLPSSNKEIKIKVSTTGVDEEIFKPLQKTVAKKMLGLDINKKYLLYVGRLNYTKRPDILIDVFEALKKERDDIELILAGHEIDDPLYEKAVESEAIMYGKILQTELYKYLSAADVYILTSLSDKIPFGGIGMLSVQALFCETPIIGSTLVSFPSNDLNKVGLIAKNKTEIKESVLKIINSEVIFDNTREVALKHYSWENISNQTANNYKNVINRKYN